MKVFISGATDYIGRAVISELGRRGHNVVALAQSKTDGKLIEAAGGKSLIGNLFDKGEWCNTIQGVDKVISLDRPVQMGEKLSQKEIDNRGQRHAEAVTNLIGAASDGKARGLVITYDAQCFGERHGKWVEGDPGAVDPIGYCRPLTNYIAAIDEAANVSGMEVVRVYSGLVYGKEGWLAGLVEDMRAGKARIVEPGNNYLNLIHVDDLAALYATVIDRYEGSNAFNFTDNMPVLQKDLYEFLSDMLDVPVPRMVDVKTYEKQFGLMAAEAMSCNTKVSSSNTFGILDFGPRLRRYDIGIPPTLKSMGIEPRAREETMKGAKAA